MELSVHLWNCGIYDTWPAPKPSSKLAIEGEPSVMLVWLETVLGSSVSPDKLDTKAAGISSRTILNDCQAQIGCQGTMD